jgi:hypothetical protein
MKLHFIARGAAAAVAVAALAITLTGAWPAPLIAQTPARQGRPGWTPLRIAKWALLATAAGFGAYAIAHSNRADDAYSELKRLCIRDPSGCRLDNGHYGNSEAEALYRDANEHDRRAQVGIFGGQIALLGSAALFIYDLRNGRGPANIPYPSSARALVPPSPALGLGMRLSF